MRWLTIHQDESSHLWAWRIQGKELKCLSTLILGQLAIALTCSSLVKYNDFMIVGTPMQLVLWILSVAVLETATDSNWWVSWLMSLLCLLVVVAIRVVDIRSLIKRE